MKKVYIKPEVIVTLLNVESQLLAGTGNNTMPDGKTPGYSDEEGDWSRDTHGIWVDVWED